MDVVERLGAADGSDKREVLEAERVLPLEQGLVNLLIEGIRVQTVNLGGAHRQRAVHIDGHLGDFVALEQIVEHEEHLLGALHREGGNQDLAAALECLADDFREVLAHAGRCFVLATAVGAFHQQEIHIMHRHRIAQHLVAAAADIAGK